MRKLFFAIALFWALGGPVYAADLPDSSAIIGFVNQARLANNLPVFREVPALDQAAKLKAVEIAGLGALVHTQAQEGSQWWETVRSGYTFSKIGENLAANISDPYTLVSEWMNSPEHRVNILNPNLTDIGVSSVPGVFEGEVGSYTVEYTAAPQIVAPTVQLNPVQTQALIESLIRQIIALLQELLIAQQQ